MVRSRRARRLNCSRPAFLPAALIPKALGRVEDIPYLARQQRLMFARCGLTDPLSLDDYRRHGGLRGLERALSLGPKATVEEVLASGLRGRGGAGFPTGVKWRTTAGVESDQKYVVCNADEGDSGTFADRMLMEGDPFLLIEGMAIAALAVGATMGYVYIRSEYPHAFAVFSRAIERARAAGLLGPSVLGSGRAFDLEARLGAGAYICGEETSLLRKPRGEARRGARQAAAAGDFRPVRQANGHQQHAELRLDAVDPGARREGLRRLRRWAVARIAAFPACRQRPLWRARRTRLRRDLARPCRGLWRRHAHRPADPRGSGRRAARRLFSRCAPRHAA